MTVVDVYFKEGCLETDLSSVKLPVGLTLKVHNLLATEENVPSKVINKLCEFKSDAFPLVFLDGDFLINGRFPVEDDFKTIKPVELIPQHKFSFTKTYVEDSAVKFSTPSRVHINFIVQDLDKSLDFYRVLFNQEPTKITPGEYAKFELEDPPINLALQTDPYGGAKGHFGIQVKSTEVIKKTKTRFLDNNFKDTVEEDGVACCFAVQDKAWAVDPEGHQWETFVVTDNASGVGCAQDCICYESPEPSMA